jgi:septal ring factor EnvC (AmiA/AmiB activator)
MSTVVFALLAVFFAVHSATTAQRAHQLANELEETKKRLREAETTTAGFSNGTP